MPNKQQEGTNVGKLITSIVPKLKLNYLLRVSIYSKSLIEMELLLNISMIIIITIITITIII